jgi:hypothetical protein
MTNGGRNWSKVDFPSCRTECEGTRPLPLVVHSGNVTFVLRRY